MYICKTPQTKQALSDYYSLRWEILRKPWGKPQGSEQDELEPQAFHRMITDDEGNILAVGRLHAVSQYQAQVRYMAVASQAQSKGLGRRMLSELERLAAEYGIKEIVLNARESALPFYQQAKFKNNGFTHRLYDEIDHYKMSKVITKPESHEAELATELQHTWHQTIPMSKAMNIDISYYNKQCLITSCDLDFNKNLHNTMFAGSVYTLGTLTGWGWVYLQLKQQGLLGDIVLAEGNIRYHKPLAGVPHARVNIEQVDGDFVALSKGKKAKIKISVEVGCGDVTAATFSGLYVVIPQDKLVNAPKEN